MKRGGGKACRLESLTPAFAVVAALDIHQALSLLQSRIVQEHRIAVSPARHLIGKVGTAHRGHVALCPLRHLGCDVSDNFLRGRGGECPPHGVGEAIVQGRNVLKSWAEVVSPLADAMGFVDNDGRHIPKAMSRLKKRMRQPFGRQVQKLGAPKANVVQNAIAVVAHPGLGANAPLSQLVALVFHQGHKRGHHQAKSTSGQSGQLKAQAFSSAGGQQSHHVFSLGQIQDRADLVGAQV